MIAPENERIQIKFTNFDMEDSTLCAKDSIGRHSQTTMTRFCEESASRWKRDGGCEKKSETGWGHKIKFEFPYD